MHRVTRLVPIALLALTVVVAAGQDSSRPRQTPPQDDQRPIFQVDVNFVRVDAIVTDGSGKPVTDLTADDFEIVERGTPQKIDTFKAVSLDGGRLDAADRSPQAISSDADEEREAARDDVRLFSVFLDDYHIMRATGMSMPQRLGQFFDTQFGPSDMVAVMRPLDPLSAVRHSRRHSRTTAAVSTVEGRKCDYKPRSPAEEWMYDATGPTIDRIRDEISLSAIKGLIMRMGGLKEGRKTLLLISEGFGETGCKNDMYMAPNLTDMGAPRNAGQRIATRQEAQRPFDLQYELNEVIGLANRHNVAIYTVDPQGLSAGVDIANTSPRGREWAESSLETLRTLAVNTDGRAVVNTNNLAPMMKQAIADSSMYYLLGYSSSVGKADGKFHEIDVKVKRRGLQVRHRKGYWAYRAEDIARLSGPAPVAKPRSVVDTALTEAATPRFRLVRTWIGTARGENGKTRVTFAWEPVSQTPGRPAAQPARVTVAAIGTDGTPYYKGAADAVSSQATAHVSFEVPPGQIQLRLAVESASAEVLDSEVRSVSVPDLTAAPLTLGTPEVFRARTLPELRQIKSATAPTPTVAREFSRTERLWIRIPVYVRDSAAPEISVRMLGRSGQPLADLPMGPATPEPSMPSVDLALSNLALGDYGIEITANAGGQQVKTVVAFRVTN